MHKKSLVLVVLACLALVIPALNCALQPSQKKLELHLEKAPSLNESVKLTCTRNIDFGITHEKIKLDFRRIDPKTGYRVEVPPQDVLVEGNFDWEEDYRPGTGPHPYEPTENHPLTVQVDISNTPRLGEPAELTLIVSTIRDIAGVKTEIEFYRMEGTDRVNVPAEDILVGGNLTWQGTLEKDAEVQLSAVVKFPQEGDWGILARALSSEMMGDSNYPLFLHVGKDKGRFGWAEPHKKPIEAPDTKPTPLPERR